MRASTIWQKTNFISSGRMEVEGIGHTPWDQIIHREIALRMAMGWSTTKSVMRRMIERKKRQIYCVCGGGWARSLRSE